MKKLERKRVYEIKGLKGKSAKEISQITGIGINTVWKYKADKRIEKNWTEPEIEKLVEWISEGISYAEIGRRLHRSANSIRIKICRQRKEIKNDPRKRAVLYYLGKAFRLEPNPTLALRALRKARIFEMGEDLKHEH